MELLIASITEEPLDVELKARHVRSFMYSGNFVQPRMRAKIVLRAKNAEAVGIEECSSPVHTRPNLEHFLIVLSWPGRVLESFFPFSSRLRTTCFNVLLKFAFVVEMTEKVITSL